VAPLLAYAEAAEYATEQIVRAEASEDLAQGFLRGAQVFGGELAAAFGEP
jgi:hypothetical protein